MFLFSLSSAVFMILLYLLNRPHCVILVWTPPVDAFDILSSSSARCQFARGRTLQAIWKSS